MAQRTRRKVLLAKIEGVSGVAEALDPATDGIQVENMKFTKTPQNTDTDEHQPSFDKSETVVGGIQAKLEFDVYLKGSLRPGQAPSWGKLLKGSGMAEVITSNTKTATTLSIEDDGATIADSAEGLAALTEGTVLFVKTPTQQAEVIVTASSAAALTVALLSGSALIDEVAGGSVSLYYGIVGTEATAGSDIGLTLQAPFAATDQLYRGMPVVLSGNPATPVASALQDYTAGRVALLPETMGAALDTGTVASIPANVLYVPSGAEPANLTMSCYQDGTVEKMKAATGSASVTWQNGVPSKIHFIFNGIYLGKEDAALPTPTFPDYNVSKPVWKKGRSRIDRQLAACSQFSLDLGNQMPFTPNPEEDEGFGAPVLTTRALTGAINPLSTLVATRDVASKFKAGTPMVIYAAMGVTPGNRHLALVPRALSTADDDDDNQGLQVESIKFDCQGVNSGFYLAVF